MKPLRVNLDGKEVEAREGETILKLARRLGVEIPALCYDPRLPPYTSCFICIVEVEGRRGVAPACATKVEEKMTIRTRTDNIVKLRKLGLELLLSNHHGDCVAPCNMACPAGIDIRSYLSEVARGHYDQALRIIKERNPLPAVCGRICPRKCEDNCRRHLVDEPVGINQVKRFVSDLDRESGKRWKPELAPRNGKRIAIIGGGPAGLSAAYYLVQLGYTPVIFEAMPKAGGMLRYGVPDYRLPQEVLDDEIRQIVGLGGELRTGQAWGKDFHLDDLRKQEFSAILVMIGAWAGQAMGVEGEDRPGIWSGIGMLEKVALGQKLSLGDRVAVVGGGNTAIDAARTALRLGSRNVYIVYRRSRKEMPAHPDEIHEAEEEGVQFHFLTAPVGFPGVGPVTSMRCEKMYLGEPDGSGRRKPVKVPGSEFDLPVDCVIAAIGQKVFWPKGFDCDGLKLTKWGTIEADEKTLSASQPDVFTGGDCFTGPATAIEAISAGRRAAYAAHARLSGEKVDLAVSPFNISKGNLKRLDKAEYQHYEKKPRLALPVLPAETRAQSWEEVARSIPERDALAEAGRCLLCGCQEVKDCLVRRYAGEYQATGEAFPGEKNKASLNTDHPYIVRDSQKCILCGRCVRVCAELQGVGAIGLAGRGFSTTVTPAWSENLKKFDCKSCGQCIATCPAGALRARMKDERVPSWRTEEQEVICPYCGTGCRLTVAIADGKVQRLLHKMSRGDHGSRDGQEVSVCTKGFTGFDLLTAGQRLREPMIKEQGKWRVAGWDEARKTAATGLRRAAETRGGKQMAVLGSPRLTNEAAYLLQKIGRAAFGTNHLGGLGLGGEKDGLARAFGYNISTATREDIAASDLLLVVGFDPEAEYQAVAALIRAAVAGGSGGAGTKLHLYYSRGTSLDKLATQTLRVAYPDTYVVFEEWLRELLSRKLENALWVGSRVKGLEDLRRAFFERQGEKKALAPWLRSEKKNRLREEFFAAQRPLVLVDAAAVHPAELAALADLLLLKGAVGNPGSGILMLRPACNGQGALDAGLDSRWLPGYRSVFDPAARGILEKLWGKPVPEGQGMATSGILQAAGNGTLAGFLSWGDQGLGTANWPASVFTVSGEWIVPAASHPASVVFPAALFVEDEGSLTSWDRYVQQVAYENRKIGLGMKPNWQILSELAQALGLPKVDGLRNLREEMGRANRLFAGWNWSQWNSGTLRKRWLAPEDGSWEGLYHDAFAFPDGTARLLVPEEEETREPLEYFSYLAEQDLVGKFIASRLAEVRRG